MPMVSDKFPGGEDMGSVPAAAIQNPCSERWQLKHSGMIFVFFEELRIVDNFSG
jgi:hypothetical protein